MKGGSRRLTPALHVWKKTWYRDKTPEEDGCPEFCPALSTLLFHIAFWHQIPLCCRENSALKSLHLVSYKTKSHCILKHKADCRHRHMSVRAHTHATFSVLLHVRKNIWCFSESGTLLRVVICFLHFHFPYFSCHALCSTKHANIFVAESTVLSIHE